MFGLGIAASSVRKVLAAGGPARPASKPGLRRHKCPEAR